MPTKQGGYTLVEILVSLAIFATLLGYAVINLRGATEQDKVKLATDSIAAQLRQARNEAFNGVIEPRTAVYPPGGYGMYFETVTDTYTRFADHDDDGHYDTTSVDERLEDLTLDGDLDFRLGGDVAITEMAIVLDGQDNPQFNNQSGCSSFPCAPLPTPETASNLIVEIIGGSGCTGTIRMSMDTGALYIETFYTNC
jgi:prepilin-type N-terminal cleavage/methylation domain-containing protein